MDDKVHNNSPGFFDLWRSKRIRKFTFVLFFSYFISSFIYYGLSLNIGELGGNLFLNFFFAGLVEFPSYYVTALGIKYNGRKILLKYFLLGTGFSCIATSLSSSDDNNFSKIVFAIAGKFFVTSTFTLCYVFASEVYPTVLRQTGLASCTICARFGGILAPFVKELVS